MEERTTARPRWFPLAIPLLLFASTAVLVFATRSAQQTGDSLSYAYAMRTGAELFHPHHLLYGPIVRLLYLAFDLVLPFARWDVLMVAQIHGTLWAATSVVLFYAVARRLLGSVALAAVGASALLASQGFWLLSTHANSYLAATGCLIGMVYLLVRRDDSAPSTSALLGLAVLWALAVLYHQVNVLFVFPLVFHLRWVSRQTLSRIVGLVLVPAGAIVLLLYVAVFFAATPGATAADFLRFPFEYARYPNPSWGTVSNISFAGLRTLFENQLWNLLAIPRPVVPVAGVLFAVGLVALLGWSVSRARRAGPRVTLVMWIVSYLLFFLWWLPDHKPLFLLTAPAILLLGWLGLHDLVQAGSCPRGRTASVTWICATLVAALAAFHLVVIILPVHAAQRDAYYEAQALHRAADADCYLMLPYEITHSLRYYFDRERAAHGRFPLLFFYQQRPLPADYDIRPGECVVVALSHVRPDQQVYGFDGYTRPEAWLEYLNWLLGIERDARGRVVAARRFGALSTASGAVYLRIEPERAAVAGLSGLCSELDEAIERDTKRDEAIFRRWLASAGREGRS